MGTDILLRCKSCRRVLANIGRANHYSDYDEAEDSICPKVNEAVSKILLHLVTLLLSGNGGEKIGFEDLEDLREDFEWILADVYGSGRLFGANKLLEILTDKIDGGIEEEKC